MPLGIHFEGHVEPPKAVESVVLGKVRSFGGRLKGMK